MLRCLSTRSATAHAHSTQLADGLQRAEVLPTLPPATQLVQPPSACQPAECWNRAGGEHGIFVRGYEDRPSMKGCSLGMILRCVRATRAIARDICPTLSVRRGVLRRFTRSVRRRYHSRSHALRDSNRVWMGPLRRRVRRDPCNRHGCAVPPPAVEGTRAWTALGHREVTKKVPTVPSMTAVSSEREARAEACA